MRRARLAAATAAFLGVAACNLQCSPVTVANAAEGPEATCDIQFIGTSTLHDFRGTMPPVPAALRPAASAGRWDADLVIPVSAITTDNDSRDARMREMFHADRWPEIRVSLAGVDPAAARDMHRLEARLTIGEVTHDVAVKVRGWKQDASQVTFDAAANVSLRYFGLEAPTVMGLVRVSDDVKIAAHVVVRMNGAGALAPVSPYAGPEQ